ncbi:prepilin peptidase [Methanosarcina sp. UBA289]|uniref:prepilin peptidase n=1 Tax=Methanosarcina sp. UBA289 TaxID=1915574 RepID=UPI0025EA4504|nr:A24 family peptidase [Methanosarcina sp. UBA289]
MTIKIIITLSFLLIACYTDLKSRKVPNKITFSWLITALIFAGYEGLHQGTLYLLTVGLSWASMSLITSFLFRAGKLGGGDVKALIALSLLYPTKALWILSIAYLLTLCSKAGRKDIKNYPFMLPITGGFLLTTL